MDSRNLPIAELENNATDAAALLKALSNESRLLILCNLVSGEKSVGELNERIPLSQSALSQHLARLRKDALVTIRKEAQTVYYRISSPEAEKVIEVLYNAYCKT
ncbi:ArsR/SmtB family transcription factor [Reinekea blandensis]|uniref:Predicted transcriptional regulator n=1 Tax=Reinekea blandensis MED297 TaxID=314283 RepID=A4BBY6_9GAMM|nr:metalloregulator ArsR/SmtB family transcription factor [Reinekea blandensis]EAR10471.1 Predicted transcriptional regulator [Reinekea sp. MED297] [Reinekea blandensis MED297]